jgi:Holliday junction resolvase RusA-like endonuclease
MSNTWKPLVIPSIQPYVRTTQRQKFCDPRYKKYAAWKSMVRVLANVAGWPQDLERDGRYKLSIRASWKGRARCDLSNIIKAVEDACFKQDRRVLWIVAYAEEDTQNPDRIFACLEQES